MIEFVRPFAADMAECGLREARCYLFGQLRWHVVTPVRTWMNILRAAIRLREGFGGQKWATDPPKL
jgi:hypothetical protein